MLNADPSRGLLRALLNFAKVRWQLYCTHSAAPWRLQTNVWSFVILGRDQGPHSHQHHSSLTRDSLPSEHGAEHITSTTTSLPGFRLLNCWGSQFSLEHCYYTWANPSLSTPTDFQLLTSWTALHIFDRGNILLLPEPLHTALQQAIVWWVERVRRQVSGQPAARCRYHLITHSTLGSLDTETTRAMPTLANTGKFTFILKCSKTLVFVSTWSNYSSPPFMTSRAAPEADCQHLASRDPGDGAGLGT